MADTVIWQGVDGDKLSEENLALLLALSNQADYVERGYGLDADYVNNTVDVGTGTYQDNLAIIKDGTLAYGVFAEPRSAVTLTADTTNYLYLWIDTDDADTLGIYADTSDVAPTATDVSADGPIAALKIGEVDTAADTTTTVNRDPDLSAETVQTGAVNGGGPVSEGDGIERQLWVINNGASDPAGASDDDLIFEREP